MYKEIKSLFRFTIIQCGHQDLELVIGLIYIDFWFILCEDTLNRGLSVHALNRPVEF